MSVGSGGAHHGRHLLLEAHFGDGVGENGVQVLEEQVNAGRALVLAAQGAPQLLHVGVALARAGVEQAAAELLQRQADALAPFDVRKGGLQLPRAAPNHLAH